MSSQTWARSRRVGHVVLMVVSLSIAVAALTSRVSVLSTRKFDPDELEHAHVAWSISQGLVPYRDFFEMHPPLFHYLIAPFIAHRDVSTGHGALETLFALRRLMWVFSAGIVLCTFVLARRLGDADTAWAALPILATDIVLAHRGIEIRPDGLSALLWLGCLSLMLSGLLSQTPRSGRTRLSFAASGLCIGAGVLTSQKLLLAGPPIVLALVWYMSSEAFAGSRRTRIANTALQTSACLAVWLVAAVVFFEHNGLAALLDSVLFQDLGWHQESSALGVLAFVMRYDPWLFAMAAAGACLGAREAITDPSKRVANAFLLVTSTGMFLGLFAIPVPFPQYCLTFLPLLAILAAGFLVKAVRALASVHGSGRIGQSREAWAIAILVFSVLATIGLWSAKPMIRSPTVYPATIAAAGLAMVLLSRRRQVELALTAIILALAIYPAQWTTWMRAEGDGGQFAELQYVQRIARPSAVVMDGWSGLGVFRPHAWYYWMLHPGVRAMLPPTAIEGLERDLTSGRVRPDVVILDDNLAHLSNAVTTFIQAHYQPTVVDRIYALSSQRGGGAGPQSIR